MTNTGQPIVEGAQTFLVRFLEIHEAQAQSARADLDRLQSLIADAGQRLMTSFDQIGEIAARESAAQDMADAVGNAVSALQFQDMAQQLVGHAAKRIEVLERITGPLSRLPQASVDELAAAVEGTVHERINGPVEQACMDGGSVELF